MSASSFFFACLGWIGSREGEHGSSWKWQAGDGTKRHNTWRANLWHLPFPLSVGNGLLGGISSQISQRRVICRGWDMGYRRQRQQTCRICLPPVYLCIVFELALPASLPFSRRPLVNGDRKFCFGRKTRNFALTSCRRFGCSLRRFTRPNCLVLALCSEGNTSIFSFLPSRRWKFKHLCGLGRESQPRCATSTLLKLP